MVCLPIILIIQNFYTFSVPWGHVNLSVLQISGVEYAAVANGQNNSDGRLPPNNFLMLIKVSGKN